VRRTPIIFYYVALEAWAAGCTLGSVRIARSCVLSVKSNGKRFFSQSMACEGPSVLEGVLGYISANDVSGATALRRSAPSV